jgi:hypothetical protein
MWGTKEVITPTNGIYSVDLPPASCSHSIGEHCMIGGYTYYLVQDAETPSPTFTPTVTPTAAPTETTTQTETPAPTDTPSPTNTPLPTATTAPSESPVPTETPTSSLITSPTPRLTPEPTADTGPSLAATSQATVDPPATAENEPLTEGVGLGFIAAGMALALVLVVAWLAQRRRG